MQFHANRVSASVSGDYYQALFEFREDTSGPEIPYLVVPRQFEEPDGGQCYIETRDEKYTGHFHLRRIDFSPFRILVEIDRPQDNVLEVTFGLARSDFEQMAWVLDIISGAKEAP